jgi:hypothetical protein
MELHRDITLSIKHQKQLRVFPYFFIPALNNFYFLRTDLGFFKPVLETWKHEGYVKFRSSEIEINIEFDSPAWIGICLGKPKSRRKIYLNELLEKLDIPFGETILTIQKTDDLEILESQINASFQKSREVIKNNWDRIAVYVKKHS